MTCHTTEGVQTTSGICPFVHKSPTDADGDGITDADDALLFSADRSTWSNFVLPPEIDGNPDTDVTGRLINFTGKGSAAVDGFTNDNGLPFDADRGFGWKRDISVSNRRRRQIDGDWRDTFLFTCSHDVWEYSLVNGSYRINICVGDSGHEQVGQNVTVEDTPLFRDLDTATGEWAEGTADVEVKDGPLTVEIGRPGTTSNTCINRLRVVAR